MPGGDRTGPNGQGAKTGRGLGYCTGNTEPGYSQPKRLGLGRGHGRGYDQGRGLRGRFIQRQDIKISTEDEENNLRQQLSVLETEIDNIKKRLNDLVSRREE